MILSAKWADTIHKLFGLSCELAGGVGDRGRCVGAVSRRRCPCAPLGWEGNVMITDRGDHCNFQCVWFEKLTHFQSQISWCWWELCGHSVKIVQIINLDVLEGPLIPKYNRLQLILSQKVVCFYLGKAKEFLVGNLQVFPCEFRPSQLAVNDVELSVQIHHILLWKKWPLIQVLLKWTKRTFTQHCFPTKKRKPFMRFACSFTRQWCFRGLKCKRSKTGFKEHIFENNIVIFSMNLWERWRHPHAYYV